MADSTQLTASEIARWLEQHPDFFRHHPALLDRLNIPHSTSATSLIERQVERLREENQRLNQRLDRLAGIAGENERLMQRLHQLTLDLMTAGGSGDFIERLCRKLGEDFEAGSVILHLFDPPRELQGIEPVRRLPEDHPEWLTRLLDTGHPECGRLTRAKLEFLFGDDAQEIGSAAVVPIDGHGLLAIGSEAAERFYPDMGTLFLELLGATIRYRLAQLDHKQRKRA